VRSDAAHKGVGAKSRQAASGGGDKQNSPVQLMTFAAQHQIHWSISGCIRSYTNEDILSGTCEKPFV
jgi:NAD(P)H dehydrogenase (quinone)